MSPILDVVAPRLLAPAVMLAAALIVKGYTDVGEGFSAGVIVALAVALRYVTLGPGRAERTLPIARQAHVVAAAGLLIALATGAASWLLGEPFLTSHFQYADLPFIGKVPLATAALFDFGVFSLVVGATVLMLIALAHQSVRRLRAARIEEPT